MLVDESTVTNPHAKQVLEILASGHYRNETGATVSIAAYQATSEADTRLYTPAQLDALRGVAISGTEANRAVEVVAATTQEAAFALTEDGRDVVVLNFASARNPGGGFLGGAQAQEEELCRCGGLYRTLMTQPEYYLVHRNNRSLLYSDHIIYSPRVPFFRLEARGKMLVQPVLLSVITAPAPNAGAITRNTPEDALHLKSTFERRWANILAVAEDRGHRNVVLGAWGCGAFRNDPVMVAEAAKNVLSGKRFVGRFERLVFAVPDFGERSRTNLESFRAVLG